MCVPHVPVFVHDCYGGGIRMKDWKWQEDRFGVRTWQGELSGKWN